MSRPLKRNLLSDGIDLCAEHVVNAINRTRGAHCVYVAIDGGVRVIPLCPANQSHRQADELVGTYTRRASADAITGDLQSRLSEIQHGATQ